MKNEKKLYICHSYIHLLISTIHAIKNKRNSNVFIVSDRKETSLHNQKKLLQQLQQSSIFDKVIIADDYTQDQKTAGHPVRHYLFYKKLYRKYHHIFEEFNSINIFYDQSSIGQALNIGNIKYNYIEDSTDAIAKNPQYVPKESFKTNLKKFFHIYQVGQSPNIQSYEVNNAAIIPDFIDKNKVIEVPKKSLFSNLTHDERKTLLNIFGTPQLNTIKDSSILLLTQPFDIGFPNIPEQDKIALYRKILKKYNKKDIIIKTHPRELTDYQQYFPGYKVISEPFPIEVINFLPIRLKEVVTVSSTAAESVYNADKHTVLGWDWLDKETNGAVYGQK